MKKIFFMLLLNLTMGYAYSMEKNTPEITDIFLQSTSNTHWRCIKMNCPENCTIHPKKETQKNSKSYIKKRKIQQENMTHHLVMWRCLKINCKAGCLDSTKLMSKL